MNISKEAIEAAEKSLRDEGLDDVGNSPHGWRCEYPDLYPGYCTCVTDLARAALEAAAPLLMAQTLREAADDAFKDKSTQGLARAVIGNWLRMKAAKIEEGL